VCVCVCGLTTLPCEIPRIRADWRAHPCMSHTNEAYMNGSCHIWMSHVIYEWVVSHMNESSGADWKSHTSAHTITHPDATHGLYSCRCGQVFQNRQSRLNRHAHSNECSHGHSNRNWDGPRSFLVFLYRSLLQKSPIKKTWTFFGVSFTGYWEFEWCRSCVTKMDKWRNGKMENDTFKQTKKDMGWLRLVGSLKV